MTASRSATGTIWCAEHRGSGPLLVSVVMNSLLMPWSAAQRTYIRFRPDAVLDDMLETGAPLSTPIPLAVRLYSSLLGNAFSVDLHMKHPSVS
jgi:hypothetical protein